MAFSSAADGAGTPPAATPTGGPGVGLNQASFALDLSYKVGDTVKALADDGDALNYSTAEQYADIGAGAAIGGTVGFIAGSFIPIPGASFVGAYVGAKIGAFVGGLLGGKKAEEEQEKALKEMQAYTKSVYRWKKQELGRLGARERSATQSQTVISYIQSQTEQYLLKLGVSRGKSSDVTRSTVSKGAISKSEFAKEHVDESIDRILYRIEGARELLAQKIYKFEGSHKDKVIQETKEAQRQTKEYADYWDNPKPRESKDV